MMEQESRTWSAAPGSAAGPVSFSVGCFPQTFIEGNGNRP